MPSISMTRSLRFAYSQVKKGNVLFTNVLESPAILIFDHYIYVRRLTFKYKLKNRVAIGSGSIRFPFSSDPIPLLLPSLTIRFHRSNFHEGSCNSGSAYASGSACSKVLAIPVPLTIPLTSLVETKL